MSAALCLALALAAPATGAQDAGHVAALIAEARYAEALREAARLGSPERERLTRRALHQAGDLPGALAAGREGLAVAPHDRELLLGTADVALTVGDARLGGELVERLEREVDELPASEPYRSWWVERAQALAREASALAGAEVARARALRRARVTTLVVGAFALVALALLARCAAPGRASAS